MKTFKRLQLVKEMITQLAVWFYCSYFIRHYKMTAIDLSKQQALDADPKAIQQTGNLAQIIDYYFSLLRSGEKLF